MSDLNFRLGGSRKLPPNGHPAEVAPPWPRNGRRGAEIAADRIVRAPAETVFAFLYDLENHWLIADRFVEVVRLDGTAGGHMGGQVRLRGPLGLPRTATTRVLAAHPPRLLAGVAETDASTRARVEWWLRPHGRATTVRLTAKVEGAGPVDRLLLSLGGRWWLRRRFASALARLALRFEGRGPLGVPPLGRLSLRRLALRPK